MTDRAERPETMRLVFRTWFADHSRLERWVSKKGVVEYRLVEKP